MPPGTMMGPMAGLMQSVGIDTIYSFVIIFVSLMIYFGTKELYDLSNHKGIKYFRLTFLFFAIAYLFRFLTQFIFLSLGHPRTLQTQIGIISLVSLMLFMYASTTAIFYLWASSQSKWFKSKSYNSFLLHAIAIIISALGILTNNILVLLIIQSAIVLLLAITTYNRDKKKKTSQQIYLLYAFLAIFWVLNVLDILVPNFLYPNQLIIYLASISIFLLLLYKVIKKTGP
ncbi:MAG: hypothetical protein ABH864_00635 [archaeon]